MKKIILILLLLGGCKGDPIEYRVLYTTRNTSNLSVEVFMYRFGKVDLLYQIASKEEYAYGLGILRGSQPQGSIVASKIMYMDSVKIKFADGKIKTDYIKDFEASTSKSIYRDEYYITEQSCPNQAYCNQYIYQIDELDYAEAK